MATQTASKKTAAAAPITFKVTLYTIGDWLILRIPKDDSAKLPTRSQVMVAGTINGHTFSSPLEPDGSWSHWLNIDAAMQKAAQVRAGDTVRVTITPIKEWSEPDVPADLYHALQADPQLRKLWHDITPLARWEWIRSTRSTLNPETRKRRIAVACSKMKSGERRPCCWNRNLCTIPEVSKNGVLLGPANETKAG